MLRAWNLTVSLPNHTGQLAGVSEALGSSGVNIEGFCGVEYEDRSIFHFLFLPEGRSAARRVFERLGHKVQEEREVLVVDIENRPGLLGEYCSTVARAGVNLTVAYLAMGSRLVLGAEDTERLAAALEVTVAPAGPAAVGRRRPAPKPSNDTAAG